MRLRLVLACGAAALTAMTGVTACGSSSSGSGGHKTLGIMTLVQSNEAVADSLAAVQKEAKAKGWSTTVIDANFDPSKESAAIQTFIARKVNGIVSIAGDNSVLASQFAAAKRAKIPVVSLNGGPTVAGITVNEDVPEESLAKTEGTDFFKAIMGLNVRNPTIIEQILPDATPCRRRESGFDQAAKNYPDVKIVKYHIDATNPTTAAHTYTSQYLGSHSNVVGVLSCWDDPALAALSAATAAKRKPFVVMGYNGESAAIAALRQPNTQFLGTAAFAITKPAVQAVDNIVDITAGKKVAAEQDGQAGVYTPTHLPPVGKLELPEWLPQS